MPASCFSRGSLTPPTRPAASVWTEPAGLPWGPFRLLDGRSCRVASGSISQPLRGRELAPVSAALTPVNPLVPAPSRSASGSALPSTFPTSPLRRDLCYGSEPLGGGPGVSPGRYPPGSGGKETAPRRGGMGDEFAKTFASQETSSASWAIRRWTDEAVLFPVRRSGETGGAR